MRQVFGVFYNQQSLLLDAYRYAERVYILSHLLSAGIMVFSTILLLHLTHLLEQPSLSRLLIIVSLAAVLSQAARYWHALRTRLGTFSLGYDTWNSGWQVAPRRAGDPFFPVPPRFVTRAHAPAPAGVRWEIDVYAERYAEVRAQLAACRAAHEQLSNHDAVNLLLMAYSLRNAEYGSSANGAPGSSPG